MTIVLFEVFINIYLLFFLRSSRITIIDKENSHMSVKSMDEQVALSF